MSNKMLLGHIDNNYYHKMFGDSCTSSKGCSSISIKNGKMIVNSLDNMINYYHMSGI